MGKQSRRKKGGNNEAKKEKEQLRIEQAQAQAQALARQRHQQRALDNAAPEELEVGRRLRRTVQNTEVEWKLGICKEVWREEATGEEEFDASLLHCKVLPLDKEDQEDSYLTIPASNGRVLKDTQPWTLRFNDRDAVFYFWKGRWIGGMIFECWPFSVWTVRTRICSFVQMRPWRPGRSASHLL